MKKIRVLIDFQAAVMQKYGGISKYTSEIVKHLIDSDRIQIMFPCLFPRSVYFEKVCGKVNDLINKKWQVRIIKFINIIYSCLFFLTHRVDIYHPSYYFPYMIPFISKETTTIITIHDLIYELFPEYFENSQRIIRGRKRLIERADEIIVVSECTKIDLLTCYPNVNPNKLHLIYEGGITDRKVTIVDSLPERYVLFVGVKTNYKNFDVFYMAMTELMAEDQELYLVCVGGEIIERYNYDNRVVQFYCSDSQLNYIYQHAICFVYPSHYEGFGIPIVEAFENNCPVILADIAVFREVAGDAAMFFSIEQNEKDCIKKCIAKCTQNEEVRQRLIRAGCNRAKNFSWDKMTREIEKLYFDCMEKKYDERSNCNICL